MTSVSQLTVGVLHFDRARGLCRHARPRLVLRHHPQVILVTLDEMRHLEVSRARVGGAGGRPAAVRHVASLDDVAGDGQAAVGGGRVPRDGDGVPHDAGDAQLAG